MRAVIQRRFGLSEKSLRQWARLLKCGCKLSRVEVLLRQELNRKRLTKGCAKLSGDRFGGVVGKIAKQRLETFHDLITKFVEAERGFNLG